MRWERMCCGLKAPRHQKTCLQDETELSLRHVSLETPTGYCTYSACMHDPTQRHVD